MITLYSVIKTPNVKSTKRKPEPDGSDYERYAEIITAYRELLKKTALAEDIALGRGRSKVPKKKEELLEWVQNPDNLDAVAESFRRTCSGYVSTGRLFAVCSGPVSFDWPTVLSMLKTSEDVLRGALAFVDIGHRGKLREEAEELEDLLKRIGAVRERIQYADLMGSLSPPPKDLSGDLSEGETSQGAS